MYFDLFPDINGDRLVNEFEKRVMFKMLTVLFSVSYNMDEDFGVVNRNDIITGKFLDIPMINYDNINLVRVLKVASKFVDDISIEKYNNPIIPQEMVEESLNIYKEYYNYFLNKEYKNNEELHTIVVYKLKTAMNECVNKEEYEKAAEYRDKISEANKDLNF